MNDNVPPANEKVELQRPTTGKGPGGLANFPPEYFAMVMATGIVSLAARDIGWDLIARALVWINTAAFIMLWVITFARFAYYRSRFINDLTHHSHSAAFLTMVAAACILGCQFVELYGWSSVAKYLWYSGIGLWVILNYTFFAVVTVRDPKPSLQVGINGVWLLTVVSTESICVLGALIAPFSKSAELILFPSLTFCLAGAAFYMFFITLILYRWMFFKMRPEKLSPDYWIDMGALAIITLSLSLLLSVSSRWELLGQLSPFLIGLMLLFWAMATWWIPFLCIVEIWRHTYGRVPFIYGPDYWSLVFPLGMYSVATTTLIKVLGLTGLHTLAVVFSVLAVATWVIVILGLLRHLARNILIEKTLL